MNLSQLETPCLILERTRLERNAQRMTQRLTNTGVALRPHMKTGKSIDVGRIAIENNFGGITVSTLKEAEYFADHGISDITYAVSIVPQKFPRIAALIERGISLTTITDQILVAEHISCLASMRGITVDMLIELDSGERRAGLLPEAPELVALAKRITDLPGLRLRGVMTHAGNSYQGRSVEDIRRIAEEERLCAVNAAERLRASGLCVDVVSVGSTPTATHFTSLEGLSEMRCGVYMFGDVFQAEINSCRIEDIAVSVLATVIGHRQDMNAVLIDAGALALSKDRSTAASGLPEDVGFGMVMDVTCKHRIGQVRVGHVYQEHGMLTTEGPFPFNELPIGARVRVLPNHACMTAAMYDIYHVIREDNETDSEIWPRINGW